MKILVALIAGLLLASPVQAAVWSFAPPGGADDFHIKLFRPITGPPTSDLWGAPLDLPNGEYVYSGSLISAGSKLTLKGFTLTDQLTSGSDIIFDVWWTKGGVRIPPGASLSYGGGTVSYNQIKNHLWALAVPEPQVWAMLLTGFALIGWRCRSRKGLSLIRPSPFKRLPLIT